MGAGQCRALVVLVFIRPFSHREHTPWQRSVQQPGFEPGLSVPDSNPMVSECSSRIHLHPRLWSVFL